MSNKSTNLLAGILLTIMFFLAFSSYWGDSATMDELSHIPAGYSYLTQKDFRINPEHPPLIKDLAAIPLLFLKLNFPKNSPAWTEAVNGQWWFGWELLYNSGNNPDKILFWARLPMVFLLVFLGFFLFRWTKKEFGNEVAIFVLTLFAFCPNFLAHGRLVTTDVGATLGVVISTYFWLNFLKNPSKKNIIIAGLILGISLLLKFSLILLVPFLGIITLVYAILKFNDFKKVMKYIFFSFLIGLISLIFVIWPVYQFHVLNYPAKKQLSDTAFLLGSSPLGPLKKLCIFLADKPVLRALGHYFLGLLMATQRTASGNTVYFMNMMSGAGWWYYFPVVYFLKIPLAFHILTLISLILTSIFIDKPFWVETKKRVSGWILNHFTEFSMLVFLAIYWLVSISGRLNIGIRHILPIFPFTYILVSLGLAFGLREIKRPELKKILVFLIAILMGWYVGSFLNSYPYFLSYFNEIAGGTENGYKYVVDSNYDWGQDLRRLAKFVEKNRIAKIKVDYFGGGDVPYYLGQKWEKFDPKTGPQKGWLAISATFLEGGKGYPVPGFNQPTGYYQWLDNYQPVARAGTSIFIYYIP